MEEIMITVPLGDYADGVIARADLDSVRALVTEGGEYCSDSIRAILGIPAKKRGGNAGTD